MHNPTQRPIIFLSILYIEVENVFSVRDVKGKLFMKKRNLKIFSGILAISVLLTAMPINAVAETMENAETEIIQDDNLSEKAEINEVQTPQKESGVESGDTLSNVETEGQCGDNVYWQWTEDGKLRIYGNGEMDGYYDPEFESIAMRPWQSFNVTEVIVEEGVSNIGDAAFSWCNNLVKVVLPESLSSIGDSAFLNCNSLTEIVLPDKVSRIGNSAFEGCSSLTEIILSDNLNSIGDFAFVLCSELKKVEIPPSVTEIGVGSFSDCNNICLYVEKDSYVHQYAQENDILFQLSDDGSDTSQEEDFVIEDGILLRYDGTAENVSIPSGVTAIGEDAFSWNEGIESVIIPEGVTEIGAYAFEHCSNLAEIIIPESVVSIGQRAFTDSQWLLNRQKENPLVIVNHILVDGSTASGSIIIPSDVTVIGAHAFEDNTEITGISMTDSIKKIGESAFSTCRSLTTLEIPDSVESMEKGIFSDCTGLKTVILPDGLSSISSILFSGCNSLTSIQIPESVRKIEGQAFFGCSALMTVEFPENLNYIGYEAFSGCSSLESLELPQKLYEIGDRTFADCVDLNKIMIPSSVYRIGTIIGETPETYKAFYNCPDVTIYGENNSYAQFYAENNNIPFQSTGENISGITLLVNNFKGEISDDQMELTWDKVPGADGYIISAAWDLVDPYREIAHIEDGSVTSYTYSGSELENVYAYAIHAYRIIDGETVLGSYSDFKINADTQQEQKIHMTVAAQERDLKNGSRTTMSKACTLKLGFDVDDPDLKLTYQTSDPAVATVKDGKITYQGVGTCTITVTAEETDTCKESSLGIKVKVGKPGAPTFTPSVTKKTAKKAFTATSSTVKGVDGWEVQYSIRKDFWKPVTKDFPNTGTKLYRKTCTTMQSKRTYYIHVRGYQIVDGKKVYSDWSPVKTVKTK